MIGDKDDEATQVFLKELTLLSEKHGITIGGCGCCGSPDLNPLEPKERGGHYEMVGSLTWLLPK